MVNKTMGITDDTHKKCVSWEVGWERTQGTLYLNMQEEEDEQPELE